MELERLQVVIEASTADFKKKVNAIKGIVNNATKNIRNETEKVKYSFDNMASDTIKTADIDKLNTKLKDTQNKLAGLNAQMDEIRAKKNAELGEMPFRSETGDGGLDEAVENSLNKDKGYRKLKNSIRDVELELERYKVTLSETLNLQEKSSTTTNRLAESLNKVKSKMQDVKNNTKSVNSGLKKTIEQTVPLSKSVFKLSNMFKLMVLRMVMRAALNAIKSGFNDLAKANNEFNSTMSTLQSSFLQARNALATAFAPVLQALTPIITTVTNAFIEAFNVIGMFTARLFGNANTFIKAKKTSTDYAKSLGDTANAAKKAEKALAAFDELNIINDKNSNSENNTGLPSADEMFEEIAIPGNITNMADKIKEIFDGIKKSFEVDPEIANSFSESFEKIKKSFEDLQIWYNNLPTVKFGNEMFSRIFGGLDIGKLFNGWLNKNLKNTKLELDTLSATLDIFLGVVTFDGEKLSKGLSNWGIAYIEKNRGLLTRIFNETIVDNLIETLQNGTLGEKMGEWWDKNIIPWFAKEKWSELAGQGYLGIGGAFATWQEADWKGKITAFWDNYVTPWFTKDKWTILSKNGFLGLSGAFATWSKEDWKRNMNLWWENHVKPFFEKNKWAGVAKDAWVSLQNGFADVINSIIGMFNKIQFKMPDWLGGKTWGINIPTVKSIPKLARGGIIDSPTIAMMGEYSGAGSNPEIVTPENLMRKIFREEMGGNGNNGEIVSLLGSILGAIKEGKIIAIDGELLANVVNRTQTNSFRMEGRTTMPL